MTDTCSIISYPASWNLKREPARPVELRKDYFGGMKFNDNFDWNNLWYDAIQLENGPILLIGPPLYDTGIFIRQNCNFLSTIGTILPFQIIEMDRACITVINYSNPLNEIILNPGHVRIPINKQDTTFNDKIVLMTLQKNNPISWIKEWIQYHSLNYGVNGVIIYDNGSNLYSAKELESAIQTPNVTVKVVEWNLPYGPQGFDCTYYNVWDSDYAQSTMFEHVKRRYLTNAKLAINCDIDELIVIENGTIDSILAELLSSNVAGFCYKGKWIEPWDREFYTPAEQVSLENRSFKNYYTTHIENKTGIGNKWLVIPKRALNYQWLVHSCPMTIQNNNMYYGHYMAMNTNWSWKRDKFERTLEDLIIEDTLFKNLNKL